MTSTTTRLFRAAAISAALLSALAAPGTTSAAGGKPAPAPAGTAVWTGNGTTVTDGTRTLNTETCNAENTPYVLWVLSGSKATTATISIDGATRAIPMVKTNVDKRGFSTFKYEMAGPIDLDALTAVASYDDGKNKAALTISHGCLGDATPHLTVVFMGEYGENPTSPGTFTYLALGTAYGQYGASTAASVCESAVPTNCVNFPTGTAAGTTGTITMSAPGAVVVNSTDNCVTALYDTPVAAADVFTAPLLTYASQGTSATATGPFSNGDTLYLNHLPVC